MKPQIARLPGAMVLMPCVLLALSLLALVASLISLQRATSSANERMIELQAAWVDIQNGPVEGSELVEAGRRVQDASRPIPAAHQLTKWSLALSTVSLLLVVWILFAFRLVRLDHASLNEDEATDARRAVCKLSDEVAPLIEGDLRVAASVEKNIAAPLASVINHAVAEQLSLLQKNTESESLIREWTKHNGQNTESTIQAISELSSHADRSTKLLAALSSNLAELSTMCSEQLNDMRSIADGTENCKIELGSTLLCLRACDSKVAAVETGLCRLQDTLRSIDEQIRAIQDVARSTELLALNTTIRVSASTEPGSGFAQSVPDVTDLGKLSEGVAQMAETLSAASEKVGVLSRGVSKGISDTMQLTEQTKDELENGIEDVLNACAVLDLTLGRSQSVERCLLQVSEDTQDHTQFIGEISQNFDLVERMSQDQLLALKESLMSLKRLDALSDELHSTLDGYTMPETAKTSNKALAGNHLINKPADSAVIHG